MMGRRPRLRDAVASGKSAADKANLFMDAAIDELDALKDFLDDPKAVGAYVKDVIQGAIAAVQEETSDEADSEAMLPIVLKLVGLVLKKTSKG